MNIISNEKKYFSSDDCELYLGDSLKLLKEIPDETFDMIFADPPYFLSNNGITCSGGKMVSVNKGEWDKAEGLSAIYKFNKDWLNESQRILKKNGTIWVSGTYHNIYSIGYSLQNLGYKILNNITWSKSNPPPNLGCRCFTHSTETIIWASKNKKSKHYFDYHLMKSINGGKQMKDVWEFPTVTKKEKRYGKHPTQKPIDLLKRIVLASTEKGDLVLDPYNGSGTTGIACKKLNRNYVGIDLDSSYLDITIKRYEDENQQIKFDI